ncbi:Blp family class II bacteriocin, partial [Priestia filamentosa]|uniref:hypothetical protein n=1 Tax=Priestia filamentosa TaxID=1402861 RepID=UPI003F15F96C
MKIEDLKLESLTEEEIIEVSGGGCLKNIGIGAVSGAFAGGSATAAATMGVGAIGGAFVGAHVGAIGGA